MAKRIDPEWAWAEYKPTPSNPWDFKKVGHLFRRAAFGADYAGLKQGIKDGPNETITKLLKGGDGLNEFEAETRKLAAPVERANNGEQAQAWWLYRMLYTPHPLREKMTLFWHNHFATSFAKVQNVRLMLGQYELMYDHALGSFAELLKEMSTDPAMLIWLDGAGSKKGMPNENYAREVMELFSLGLNHYTERDIREAAKAFTGWEVRDGEPVFVESQFDDGAKTVLGKTGRFKPDDIVKICLDQPCCPGFIVTKLYRFLVSEAEAPSQELIQPLAKAYLESGYDTAKLAETVLRSNLFFSDTAYRSRIKSPVDFAIGIANGLEGRIGTTEMAQQLQLLGQSVFNPPSVKGWDGGRAWLNGQTLLFRQNLALAMTSTEFGTSADPAKVAAKYNKTGDAEAVDFFVDLYLQGDVPREARDRLAGYMKESRDQQFPVYWTQDDVTAHRLRALCHLVLTQPQFQLD